MVWFNCATRQPIAHNIGGTISGPIGVVLHQTAHNDPNWNPWAWFNNPTARVSAHFYISGGGQIFQFIDSSRVAWHAVALNAAYLGVEVGGPAAMATTPQQIAAFGRLMAEASSRLGIPLQLANRNGERGLGFHRMPGSATSTACPSDLRLGARPAILNAARGGAPTQPPTPTPKPPTPQPGGKAPPWPGVYLKYPPLTTSPAARTWQQRMRDRGWRNIQVDGQYGPNSKQICVLFQREKGLTADGIVGPATWRATWEAAIT